MRNNFYCVIVATLLLAFSSLMITARTVLAANDGATVTLSVDTESFTTDQPVFVHVTIAK